jgi:hypothetical protein
MGIKAVGGEPLSLPQSESARLLKLIESRPEEHGVLLAFTSGMHPGEGWARGVLRGAGIPLVVLDLGYINRAQGPQDATGTNQIGIGRIGWIPDISCPSDRWDALKLSISPPAAPTREKIALVLGQMPADSQHGMNVAQMSTYLSERAGFWQARGYQIRFRPHPGSMHSTLEHVVGAELRQCNVETLTKAFSETRVAITYNSTSGVEAILAGVPVDCAPDAHYARVADYGWGEIAGKEGRPFVGAVETREYFHRLSYAQWLIPEIQNGSAIRFLAKAAIPKLHALIGSAEAELAARLAMINQTQEATA